MALPTDDTPTAPLPALDQLPAPSSEDHYRLSAAYVSASLFAGGLVRKIQSVLSGAVPSPHSASRSIVYRDELEELRKATPDAYLQPALDEAVRLCGEIKLLQRSRKEADSAKAALQRIAEDLSTALQAQQGSPVTLTEALERARDLAQTELRASATDLTKYPHESELAACFYPIKIANVDQLRTGDCVFVIEKKVIAYQHGNPREETPVETVINQPGTVVLRPFGSQAVLALRWNRSTELLKHMVKLCPEKKHQGRKEGLLSALELLTAPSWLLSPVIAAPSAAQPANLAAP
jgi:hypothetical protein